MYELTKTQAQSPMMPPTMLAKKGILRRAALKPAPVQQVPPPQTFTGPEGQMTQVKQSIPEFDKPQPIPDVRIMLNVDLMKFKPGDVVRQIKSFF